MRTVRLCVLCILALATGLFVSIGSAQSTEVVVDARLQSLCYGGHENSPDINLWLWERQVGHPIPLDKQEVAAEMMGKKASLRKLSSSDATLVGARNGHNYLVAVCVANSPPIHSEQAFEEWGISQNLGWNIDNRYNRVLTSAVGMGGGPNARRSLIYYSFPSRFTLDNHEHALAWAR